MSFESEKSIEGGSAEKKEEGNILKSILTFDNPKSDYYETLERNFMTLSEGFRETRYIGLLMAALGIKHEDLNISNWLLKDEVENMRRIFKKIKENQFLIDLGSGEECAGAEVAERLQIQTYVGVEKYGFPQHKLNPYQDIAPLHPSTESSQEIGYFKGKEGFKAMNFIIVKDGMLNFVSKMQPGRYNFLLSGLNSLIYARDARDSSYQESVAKEIKRVCQPGSIILSQSSDEITDYFSEEFEVIYEYSSGTAILEKKIPVSKPNK